MEVLEHSVIENWSDYAITWWLRDMAGVRKSILALSCGCPRTWHVCRQVNLNHLCGSARMWQVCERYAQPTKWQHRDAECVQADVLRPSGGSM